MNIPVPLPPPPPIIQFENMPNRIDASASKKEMCTLLSIRNHINQHTTFRETGEVVGFDKNSTSSNSRVFYDPGICNLEPRLGDFTWLSSCFTKTNTSKVLFVGDSNIRKLAQRLLGLLEETGMFKCNDAHNNNTLRNKDGEIEILKIKLEEDCKWVYRRVYSCARTTEKDSFSSLVIYFTVLTTLKTPIYFKDVNFTSYANRNCPRKLHNDTKTIEQYIFGDYVQQVKPDIIILDCTSHTRYLTLSEWREQQIWLMTQVSSLVPQSIPVVWFSQMSWCEQNLPPDNPDYVNRVEDNGIIYSINTHVRRQNMELYQLFKQVLSTDHSNIFPFFDIYNLSSLVRPEWYVDWIHGRPEYYELLLRTFWGVFCNSFI